MTTTTTERQQLTMLVVDCNMIVSMGSSVMLRRMGLPLAILRQSTQSDVPIRPRFKSPPLIGTSLRASSTVHVATIRQRGNVRLTGRLCYAQCRNFVESLRKPKVNISS